MSKPPNPVPFETMEGRYLDAWYYVTYPRDGFRALPWWVWLQWASAQGYL